jgi:hypothetical protein
MNTKLLFVLAIGAWWFFLRKPADPEPQFGPPGSPPEWYRIYS